MVSVFSPVFVDAFDVVQNDLIERMIGEDLEFAGLPGFPDRNGKTDTCDETTVGSLEGGYAIPARDGELFEPACC